MATWSAQCCFGDEVDKYLEQAGKEADPITLIRKHARTFRGRSKMFFCSTPAGRFIRKGVAACHQIWEYRLRCPHCSELIRPEGEHLGIDDKSTIEQIERDGVTLACHLCGGEMDEQRRIQAIRGGAWVATKGGDVLRPERVGFIHRAWDCLDVTLKEIGVAWLKNLAGKLTDKIAWANGVEANDYQAELKDRDEEYILRLKDESLPRRAVPRETSCLLLLVDTQKYGFRYQVWACGWGEDMSISVIDRGMVRGFGNLVDLAEKDWKDADGNAHRVAAAWIDSGGGTDPYHPKHSRTREVYLFCKKNPVFSPIKGRRTQSLPWNITRLEYLPSRSGKKIPIAGGLTPSLLLATGERIRIHFRYLSDAYAVKMTIGLQATSGDAWDIDPDTFRKVTKGGSETISISAAGAISDYISLHVDGTRAIVISYYGVSGTIPRLYSATAGVGVYRRLSGDYTSPADQSSFTAYSTPVHVWQSITIDDGVVIVRSDLDQSWGLFSDHLQSPLIQSWHLMADVHKSELSQPWGMRIGADCSQRWSDAPVIKGMLNQPWGNAGLIKAQLVQRWRDMVILRAMLDQPWAIMESLLAALDQPWAITEGPVQILLNQGWSIKDITPVLAALHQPWSLAADGTVLRYTVEVLADGQPVRVSHVNIEGGFDESGDVLTCEIHPETEAEYLLCPFGAELQVSITSQEGTDAFVFVVTDPRINEQHGSTSYVIEAMSPAAMLGAPYAAVIDGELSGQASEIAATLAGDLSISWETVDWNIPGATWIASGETPLALLKILAAAVGALVQSDPDGTIAIRPRYPVSVPKWSTAPPDVILTETLDCFENGSTPDHRYGYNRFLISNQSSSADSLTLEQTDISSIIKEVRGYQVPWDGLFDLTHTGGDWVIIEPMGIEEREETETVEFVAGAGSTHYPVHDLVSVVWQQTNLGTITTAEDGSLTAAIEGQSLCEITYATKCRLWRVTDGKDEQLQLVAEV